MILINQKIFRGEINEFVFFKLKFKTRTFKRKFIAVCAILNNSELKIEDEGKVKTYRNTIKRLSCPSMNALRYLYFKETLRVGNKTKGVHAKTPEAIVD
jgi:hypothetical protein